jgi:hypothetical protein
MRRYLLWICVAVLLSGPPAMADGLWVEVRCWERTVRETPTGPPVMPGMPADAKVLATLTAWAELDKPFVGRQQSGTGTADASGVLRENGGIYQLEIDGGHWRQVVIPGFSPAQEGWHSHVVLMAALDDWSSVPCGGHQEVSDGETASGREYGIAVKLTRKQPDPGAVAGSGRADKESRPCGSGGRCSFLPACLRKLLGMP